MSSAQGSDPVESVSPKKKTLSDVWSIAVLVGILGCLGAIATPKFVTFSCAAKQSEAKTNLSGLYTAEKAFFGEYGFFTTDLVSVNWAPDGTPRYIFGFSAPSSPRTDPRLPGLDPTRRTTLDPRVRENHYSSGKMIALDQRSLTDADLARGGAAASATTSGFLALAVGDIDPDSGAEPLFDIWSIDEARRLTAVSNDCTN